ncbi:hypothetical protein ABPG75_001309 [Micractinium tetrahymenae]
MAGEVELQAPQVAPQQNGSTTGKEAAATPPAAAATGLAGPSLQPAATHVQRDAPGEVAATSTEEDYLEYRATTDMREPYRIPAEYLVGTKTFIGPDVADTPLIVFINAKSGGRVGPRLLTVLFKALGQAQVFDLAESRPAPVLRTIWDNLLAAEARGDPLAGHIRRSLRILAAGGDGTVTWLLKTIRELRLDPPPAVAIMPLGTGNDLALSFGWGNAFLDRWIKAPQLYRTLKRFADASVRHLDCWDVSITAPDPSFFEELPYALSIAADEPRVARGQFWNYLSLGLDAEAAYGFHSLREAHAWAASNRLANQAWYSWYSCTSGWFCGAQPLTNKMRLRVRDEEGGQWREVAVPRSVRALVLLNIQSYGGGRDIVGLDDSTLLQGQQFKRDPIFDDGLIEVVGFGSGWHAALAMAQVSSRLHAVRLAQCREVEVELVARGGKVKDEMGYTHMQVDGEPWRQPIPAAPDALRARRPSFLQQQQRDSGGAAQQAQQAQQRPVVLRVSHGGQSEMLFNDREPQGIRRARKMAARGAAHSQVQPSELSSLPSTLHSLVAAAAQQKLSAAQPQ